MTLNFLSQFCYVVSIIDDSCYTFSSKLKLSGCSIWFTKNLEVVNTLPFPCTKILDGVLFFFFGIYYSLYISRCSVPVMTVSPISLSYGLVFWVYNLLGSFPLTTRFLRMNFTQVVVTMVSVQFVLWGGPRPRIVEGLLSLGSVKSP